MFHTSFADRRNKWVFDGLFCRRKIMNNWILCWNLILSDMIHCANTGHVVSRGPFFEKNANQAKILECWRQKCWIMPRIINNPVVVSWRNLNESQSDKTFFFSGRISMFIFFLFLQNILTLAQFSGNPLMQATIFEIFFFHTPLKKPT